MAQSQGWLEIARHYFSFHLYGFILHIFIGDLSTMQNYQLSCVAA